MALAVCAGCSAAGPPAPRPVEHLPEGTSPQQSPGRANTADQASPRNTAALPVASGCIPGNFEFVDNGGSILFRWDYRNPGDYTQDGEVNVSDITPIAIYFGATPASGNWAEAAVADGDSNGEVNAADITPIAIGYSTTVNGYRLETADSPGGPYSEAGSVLLAAGTADPALHFELELPAAGLMDWCRVRAFASEDPAQGAATVPLSLSGQTGSEVPEAYAYCMPKEGWDPLTVFFSPFASTDDIAITRWEWDFDGDGSYDTDASSTSGYASHTYTSAGTYTPKLRVTDTDGSTDIATTTVTVRSSSGSTVDYWGIFDTSGVDRMDFTVAQADWDAMWANVEAELEIPADVAFQGETLVQAGLKFKGNGSLFGTGAKKPWKIDTNKFTSGQEFRNLKMLILNNNFEDPSLLREHLGYEMLRFAGIPAGFTSFAEVWIDISGDGQPAEYWGVYTMVERVDKKFLENRFLDDNGNLYKADAWFEEGGADLAYYGPDIESYPKPRGEIAYGKETNTTAADYSDIINLCYTIDGAVYDTPDDFAAAVEQVLNVDDYLRYMAVNVACDNWDVYPFSANNYYLYDDPATGIFRWIPWDLNMCYSGNTERPLYSNTVWGGPVTYAPLHEKVFSRQRYLQDYAAYLDLLQRYWFNEGLARPRAQQLHDMLKPYIGQATGDKMYYDPDAPFTEDDFDANWDMSAAGHAGIADFTAARALFIDQHLPEYLTFLP